MYHDSLLVRQVAPQLHNSLLIGACFAAAAKNGLRTHSSSCCLFLYNLGARDSIARHERRAANVLVASADIPLHVRRCLLSEVL